MAEGYTFEDDFFAESIKPPAATFEDTLVLFHGWSEGDADMHISVLLDEARELFTKHGGSREQLPLNPPSYDELFDELEESPPVYGSGFTEDIARLTHKYLIGEGEDYEAFVS